MSANSQPSEASLVSIVDDDSSVRRSTLRLLSSSGLRAEAFASAADFLQSERVAETGCLLLDVKMPGMDGLELQRHLSARGLAVPIVFFTAHASEEDERQALAAGASSFLRKPVTKEVLLNAILAVL
jgi:FixJ family two-component response regulator